MFCILKILFSHLYYDLLVENIYIVGTIYTHLFFLLQQYKYLKYEIKIVILKKNKYFNIIYLLHYKQKIFFSYYVITLIAPIRYLVAIIFCDKYSNRVNGYQHVNHYHNDATWYNVVFRFNLQSKTDESISRVSFVYVGYKRN